MLVSGAWLREHHVFGDWDEDERPYHCVWGNGDEISGDEMTQLKDAHDQSTIQLALEKGDVVVLDNWRMSHGRTPYTDDPKMQRSIGLLLSEQFGERQPLQNPPESFINDREEANSMSIPSQEEIAQETEAWRTRNELPEDNHGYSDDEEDSESIVPPSMDHEEL